MREVVRRLMASGFACMALAGGWNHDWGFFCFGLWGLAWVLTLESS